MSINLYSYDSTTFVLTGVAEAILDPLETKLAGTDTYFTIENTTLIVPPDYSGTKIPKFNENLNQWTLINDFRGCIVTDKISKEDYVYDKVGDLPDNLTILQISGQNTHYVKWDSDLNNWVDDDEALKELSQAKRNMLLTASDAKIMRYMSEKTLISAGLLNKTTNTESEIITWESYRQLLRNFMIDWTKTKEYPIPPDIA